MTHPSPRRSRAAPRRARRRDRDRDHREQPPRAAAAAAAIIGALVGVTALHYRRQELTHDAAAQGVVWTCCSDHCSRAKRENIWSIRHDHASPQRITAVLAGLRNGTAGRH